MDDDEMPSSSSFWSNAQSEAKRACSYAYMPKRAERAPVHTAIAQHEMLRNNLEGCSTARGGSVVPPT